MQNAESSRYKGYSTTKAIGDPTHAEHVGI